jgi:hypothetical protein
LPGWALARLEAKIPSGEYAVDLWRWRLVFEHTA